MRHRPIQIEPRPSGGQRLEFNLQVVDSNRKLELELSTEPITGKIVRQETKAAMPHSSPLSWRSR
jgi:hypothetical protein